MILKHTPRLVWPLLLAMVTLQGLPAQAAATTAVKATTSMGRQLTIQPAPMIQGTAWPVFEQAYTAAAATQSAVAMQDWSGADLNLADLKNAVARMALVPQAPTQLKDSLNKIVPGLNTLSAAVRDRNQATANTQSYQLVLAFSNALDSLQAAALPGGGGGLALSPAAQEQFNLAYQGAVALQTSALMGDTQTSKVRLDVLRIQLDEAARANPSAPLKQQIDALSRQTLAMLGHVDQAQQLQQDSRTLVASFAKAILELANAGGGGGPAGAPGAPGRMMDPILFGKQK